MAQQLIQDTAQSLLENLVEDSFPPAKVIILATKLSKAFADGAGAALLEANARLKASYDDAIAGSAPSAGEGMTPEQIEKLQHVRRWQANATLELNGILKAGMVTMGKEALKELAEEVTEYVFKAAHEKYIESTCEQLKIGIFDRVSKRWTTETLFVREPPGAIQDFIEEKVVGEVVKEFLKAAASMGIEKKAWPALETAAKLTEGGADPAMAAAIASELVGANLGFEEIGTDVADKIATVEKRWKASTEARREVPQLPGELRRYEGEWKTAYAELKAARASYSRFGDLFETETAKKERAKAKEALGAAKVALVGLDMSVHYAAARFATDISFMPDMASLDSAMERETTR